MVHLIDDPRHRSPSSLAFILDIGTYVQNQSPDCPSYWSPTVSIRRDGLIDNPLMCRAGVLIPPIWYCGRQELKVCVVKKDWIQWIDQGDRWILMWASSSPPPFTHILAHTVVLEHSQDLPNFYKSFFFTGLALFQKGTCELRNKDPIQTQFFLK